MEGLSVIKANLVVYLHPSQSKNVNQAILRQLSNLLFKYDEAFGGVVLAYSVNFEDKLARILSGVHPYFGVRLKATMLIFSPKQDTLLEGKVVKITPESVHVIVLGFSSAVIAVEDIRDEFIYNKKKEGQSSYCSTLHRRHTIKVGDVIRFVVKSLDEDTLHMSGSLVPAHTGNARWLNKQTKDMAIDSGSKKRPQPDGEIEVAEHGSAGGNKLFVDDDKKTKKSKKHINAENN